MTELAGCTFETESGTATITGPAPWSDQYVLVEIDCGDGVVLKTSRLEAHARLAVALEGDA